MTQTMPTIERPPSLRMTFEEFLEWTNDNPFAEWVDGEVKFFMPTGMVHVRILRFLIRLLSEYVERYQLGEVFLHLS